MVLVLACGRVCVVRPFPGGRHSHAARHARPAQAMRLTANIHFSVIESCNLRQFNSINYKDLRNVT